MNAFLKDTITLYRNDERGVVAILFALMLVGVLLIVGLAIDVGRATRATSRLDAALDAAALAGAKGIRLQGLNAAETRLVAERVFRENLASQDDSPLVVNDLAVAVDLNKSRVQVSTNSEIPMTLGQLAGIDKMDFNRSATAIFEAKDIEVAVMLDVTGSMCNPCSKIDALKDATKTLVDIMIPEEETGQKVRVAFAPYSSGVNAGVHAFNATDGASAAAGNTCTFERADASLQATDAAPLNQAALRTTETVPNWCPSATVLPLTDDKQLLKQTVDGYTTGGATAGHLGAAWAFYLLSPEWSQVWGNSASAPVSYDDDRAQKFAIIMTDGEFNTFEGKSPWSGDGDAVNKSSNAAKATCADMKEKGIVVYTVGFQLNAATAQSVMSECATDASKAFNADDAAALEAAFRKIAEDIVTLRLTN